MLLTISHRTTYSYSRPVRLGPHRLHLHPRRDHHHELLSYRLEVQPSPIDRSEGWDREANHITQLSFEGETEQLTILSEFRIRTGPCNDITANAAETRSPSPAGVTRGRKPAEVQELARALGRKGEDPATFLERLNQRLHQEVDLEVRPFGSPRPPEETLRLGRGACRDLAVVFMAVCRGQNIPARFVSGYQARSHSGRRERFMHAWPEAWLPGVGWRGYDPTHGRRVDSGHVAVAAAVDPEQAAPIRGTFLGEARSSLQTDLHIDVSP